MANLIRSPKSGSDWTVNDLTAYNITVFRQNAATFFGQADLPAPPHHPDLLNRLMADEMEDDESYQVVRYMDLAMDLVPGEESAVDDFAMQLLRVMGYAGRALGRDLRSRKDIPLFICGEWRHTKTDVCVMDRDGYLLLVQEDKRHLEVVDPEPQLVAEAIAAEPNAGPSRLGSPRHQSDGRNHDDRDVPDIFQNSCHVGIDRGHSERRISSYTHSRGHASPNRS